MKTVRVMKRMAEAPRVVPMVHFFVRDYAIFALLCSISISLSLLIRYTYYSLSSFSADALSNKILLEIAVKFYFI